MCLFIYFYFVYMNFCLHLCVHYANSVPGMAIRRNWYHCNWSYRYLQSPCEYQGPNPVPLQEQQVFFNTEPSFWSPQLKTFYSQKHTIKHQGSKQNVQLRTQIVQKAGECLRIFTMTFWAQSKETMLVACQSCSRPSQYPL